MLGDIRYSLKALWRTRGFTALTIASLAIGIGAATAVFSAVDSLLLHPYPYPDANRIVVMSQANDAGTLMRSYVNVDRFNVIRQARTLDDAMIWDEFWMWTSRNGVPDTIYTAKLSPKAFAFLGVTPVVGREFAPSAGVSSSETVALLSHRYWQRHYGGSLDALGKSLRLDGRDYAIVGVMPERFHFANADVYIPLPPTNAPLPTLLKLKEGVTPTAAAAELQVLIQNDSQGDAGRPARVIVSLSSLVDFSSGDMSTVLALLTAAVALLLVIGCANVSILLLTRGTTRREEFAVRLALGASRWSIVQQVLTESVVLALCGAVLGVALASGLLVLVERWIPSGTISSELSIAMNVDALWFTTIVATLCGVAAGVVPALRFSRRHVDLSNQLIARSATTVDRRSARAYWALTVSQVALSVLLVAGSAAAFRTFVRLATAPLGFEPAGVSIFALTLRAGAYSDWQARVTYYDRLRAAVASVPGVDAASLKGPGPMPPRENGRTRVEQPGVPASDATVVYTAVGSEYFTALQIPLRNGRSWSGSDDVRPAHVAVVNEAMARQYWPHESPIGQRIKLSSLQRRGPWQLDSPGNDQWVEVVGVAGDVRNDGLSRPVLPHVYVPFTLLPGDGLMLVTRSSRPLPLILDEVRRQVATINTEQPVLASFTLDDRLRQEGWARQQFAASIFFACAAFALALAAVGIYSVVASSVTERLREYGIRMALGASRTQLIAGVVAYAGRMIVPGLVAGILLVAAVQLPLATWTESRMFDVQILLIATVVLVISGLVAALLPVRRVLDLSPVRVLRSE